MRKKIETTAIICDKCRRKIEKCPALIIIVPTVSQREFCYDCAISLLNSIKEDNKHESDSLQADISLHR